MEASPFSVCPSIFSKEPMRGKNLPPTTGCLLRFGNGSAFQVTNWTPPPSPNAQHTSPFSSGMLFVLYYVPMGLVWRHLVSFHNMCICIFPRNRSLIVRIQEYIIVKYYICNLSFIATVMLAQNQWQGHPSIFFCVHFLWMSAFRYCNIQFSLVVHSRQMWKSEQSMYSNWQTAHSFALSPQCSSWAWCQCGV